MCRRSKTTIVQWKVLFGTQARHTAIRFSSVGLSVIDRKPAVFANSVLDDLNFSLKAQCQCTNQFIFSINYTVTMHNGVYTEPLRANKTVEWRLASRIFHILVSWWRLQRVVGGLWTVWRPPGSDRSLYAKCVKKQRLCQSTTPSPTAHCN